MAFRWSCKQLIQLRWVLMSSKAAQIKFPQSCIKVRYILFALLASNVNSLWNSGTWLSYYIGLLSSSNSMFLFSSRANSVTWSYFMNFFGVEFRLCCGLGLDDFVEFASIFGKWTLVFSDCALVISNCCILTLYTLTLGKYMLYN